MNKKVKAEILVVDDHYLILEGISQVVNKMPEAKVVNAVTSGKEAVELIDKRDYDIYILDVSIPDVSGFDLIERIRELNEYARIIVYTMHEEIWMVNRLVQSKVNAVVLKSSAVSELVTAIRSVLQGDTYACARFDSISRKLHRTPATFHSRDIPTKRELDVLQAVSQGLNTRQIAELLNISENTVETFRKRLIFKFSARNAIDMVLKAVSQGWIGVETK